jgi:dihydrodipicolinate synthase/N-acetylneuraminate lyase
MLKIFVPETDFSSYDQFCEQFRIVIPEAFKEITSLCEKQEYEKARELLKQKEDICDSMFFESNPQCIKYALYLMRKTSPFLRLPLIEPCSENKEKVRIILKKHGLIN